jgi:hypothetical protein
MRGIVVSTFRAGPASAGFFWACLLWACVLWASPLLAALPEGLEGEWQGAVEIDGAQGVVLASLVDRGQGFEVELVVPGAAPLQARFVPSERARVFEVAAASRGLFGFFDGSDRANPFDGAPLIWARASGVGIVAYRLAIATDGGMTLLRIALEPIEGQLQVKVEQRVDARPALRFETLLEPAG